MSENCDVIVIFPTYCQFGAIWKPDSRWIVCKTYIFITTLTSKRTTKKPTQIRVNKIKLSHFQNLNIA